MLAAAVLAARLISYVVGDTALDVTFVLCVLVIVNGSRWRLWWLDRRLIGRHIKFDPDGEATISGVLTNQPGVWVQLTITRRPGRQLPSQIVRTMATAELSAVRFAWPERWRYWLPPRFDRV